MSAVAHVQEWGREEETPASAWFELLETLEAFDDFMFWLHGQGWPSDLRHAVERHGDAVLE